MAGASVAARSSSCCMVAAVVRERLWVEFAAGQSGVSTGISPGARTGSQTSARNAAAVAASSGAPACPPAAARLPSAPSSTGVGHGQEAQSEKKVETMVAGSALAGRRWQAAAVSSAHAIPPKNPAPLPGEARDEEMV